ncbi:hypothetical protein GI582_08865 [Sulfitobacter sp. BDSS02]|nr:hypothetical protein [Sulfitobacter sp. BDSS02]MBR9849918.1 hypothetical protein [Paracoccaceae bacterium]
MDKLATALAIGSIMVSQVHAQELCKAPYDQARSESELSQIAEKLLEAINESNERMYIRFGDDVFKNPRKLSVETENGTENLGAVYGRYLKEAGYPSYNDASDCSILLRKLGLDEYSMNQMVMPSTDPQQIDNLLQALEEIASHD